MYSFETTPLALPSFPDMRVSYLIDHLVAMEITQLTTKSNGKR